MTAYLVTGATGFLGGQLVERLLADPEAVVHVLVRDGSRGKLASRARRWTGGDRVRPLVGDLLLPAPRRGRRHRERADAARSTTSCTWPPSTT